MALPWWLPCILAAMAWGLQYACAEEVFKRVPVSAYLFLSYLFSLFVMGFIWLGPSIKGDQMFLYDKWDWKFALLFFITIGSGIIGNVLISTAIKTAGASYSGIVEITYPLFIIIFAWLLFRHPIQNPGWFLLGSLLVIAGVGIIIAKART